MCFSPEPLSHSSAMRTNPSNRKVDRLGPSVIEQPSIPALAKMTCAENEAGPDTDCVRLVRTNDRDRVRHPVLQAADEDLYVWLRPTKPPYVSGLSSEA